MKVDKLPLNRVFDRTERLEAPLFQRPYVWERDRNWEPLWSTIRTVAEARLHNYEHRTSFLGELVLDQLETPMSHIHARQIIDGQQRLTTFQMVLAAARDLCAALGEQRFSEAFRKLTDNDVPLSDNPDDVFKVWPTNADRRVFRDTMTAGNKKNIVALAFNDALIPQGYLYFYNLLQEWLGSPDVPLFCSRLEALHQALREDLHLVIIDLESDDDPQEIFETLNALGTPLLPADLIKPRLHRRRDLGRRSHPEANQRAVQTCTYDMAAPGAPLRARNFCPHPGSTLLHAPTAHGEKIRYATAFLEMGFVYSGRPSKRRHCYGADRQHHYEHRRLHVVQRCFTGPQRYSSRSPRSETRRP
jgi:hypothetical protein